jgi:hypothetical protein
MSASLRALLHEAIDYAGVFPPAVLPLDQSIKNYARYRKDPDSWMLGRFVCGIGHLNDLRPYTELYRENPPFRVAAVADKRDTGGGFNCGLFPDENTIYCFEGNNKGLVTVQQYEARMPVVLKANMGQMLMGGIMPPPEITPTHIAVQIVEKIGMILLPLHKATLTPYLEVEYDQNWRTVVGDVLNVIVTQKTYPAGFKLRCGAVHPADVPTPEQVAFTIAACRDLGLPLKLTAGLHHPVRHHNAGFKGKMHGFINILTAGVLAHARSLTEEQLQPIIEDEDPASFHFDDDGLRWHDRQATVEEIQRARQEGITSFGSCSFDEPREDLRKLGWLS